VNLTEPNSGTDSALKKFSAELPEMQILSLGPFQTNCYILSLPSGDCLVIDPGMDPWPALEYLEQKQLQPRAILLTHGHLDHISGCRALEAEYNCPLFIHPADRFLYDALSEHARAYGYEIEPAPEKTEDLSDGQRISFGQAELEVICTPGHSPGSVCYRLALQGAADLLICGDTIFQGSHGRTDLPGGNLSVLYHSIISRVFSLSGDTRIFPGHGPETTVADEKDTNPILMSYSEN
jgi:hydroxyacylglutathione hydrolase